MDFLYQVWFGSLAGLRYNGDRSFFFILLMKFSVYSMSTDFVWVLPLLSYKMGGGSQNGENIEFISDFERFFSLDSLSNFLSVFFKQI